MIGLGAVGPDLKLNRVCCFPLDPDIDAGGAFVDLSFLARGLAYGQLDV